MILGVTGTAMPFDRLVRALHEYAQSHPTEAVWVQYGRASPPAGLQGQAFVPRDAMLERMRVADVVVCHAGSGTLLDALSCGQVPVVMPRRHALREHVNDHQLEIARALDADGRVIAALEEHDLAEAIQRARAARSSHSTGDAGRLLAALAREAEALGRPAPRAGWIWPALRALTRWVPLHPVTPASAGASS